MEEARGQGQGRSWRAAAMLAQQALAVEQLARRLLTLRPLLGLLLLLAPPLHQPSLLALRVRLTLLQPRQRPRRQRGCPPPLLRAVELLRAGAQQVLGAEGWPGREGR